MTKQTKQVYETPTTESLELRFEGVICESGGAGSDDNVFNDGDY